jgi:hypothetical protein
MTKRKTRKGGQKVRTDYLNMELTTLCEHSFDCGASVFYFLGYSDLETSKYLARHSPRGLNDENEVLPMLNLAYRNVKWEPVTAIENLNPNEATMALIMLEGQSMAHYIILYRTLEPFLYVFDPQRDLNLPLDKYLEMDKRDMIVLNYINSENVMDVGEHRVTKEIINTVLGIVPRKRSIEYDEDSDLSLLEPRSEDLHVDLEPSDDFLDSI